MSQNISNQSNQVQAGQLPEQVSPASNNGATGYYSIEIVMARTGLGVQMVQRCVSYGIITPQTSNQAELFSDVDLLRLRKVRRLVSELGLNWAGVEIVMRLTDELEQLQQELNLLRRQ